MNSQAKTEQPFSIILFDLGNVLVQIDYAAFPRTLGFDHQMTKSELFHLVEDEARAFEMGKSSAMEFLGVINARLGKSYTFDQFRKAWAAILPGPVPGSPERDPQFLSGSDDMEKGIPERLSWRHVKGWFFGASDHAHSRGAEDHFSPYLSKAPPRASLGLQV